MLADCRVAGRNAGNCKGGQAGVCGIRAQVPSMIFLLFFDEKLTIPQRCRRDCHAYLPQNMKH